MKKIKLGNLDIFSLEERDLKNVFGGLAAVSTVYTSSTSTPTRTAGKSDSDLSGTDTDSNLRITDDILG